MTTDTMPAPVDLDDSLDWDTPDEAWEPVEYTTPVSPHTRGDEVIDFARSFLTFTRGFKQGEPIEFSPWQRWLIRCMLEENDADGLLRFRRFICLLPRKNGKSLIASAIVLHGLFYSTVGDQIYSVAKDYKQARIVFEEARDQVLRSPVLSAFIEVRAESLINKATGVVYRALSSDAGGAQGFAPSLVVADEMHSWAEKGRQLYSAMTEGSGDRRESLFIGISTAGDSSESLLGELCDYGNTVARKQEAGEEYDHTFGYCYWGATEDEDPHSPDTWRKANPNLASGMMSEDDFSSSLSQAEKTNMNSFLRFRLNVWVRVGVETFITAKQYDDATDTMATLKPGTRIAIGFDGSISDDNTGMVAADIETGTLYKLALWKNENNDPDWTVPILEVMDTIRRVLDEFEVVKFYADPYLFQTEFMALGMEHPGVFATIPQTRSRMAPLTASFKIGLTSGAFRMSPDAELRQHCLNAILRPASGLVAKERPKSQKKIDLLVCSILAVAARQEVLDSDAWASNIIGSAL